MSSKTTNLNLTKPSEDEFYDINVQNENMDIIDREINGLKQPAYEVSTAMSDLHSGEMITVAFGKIANAVSTLISHITSKATSSVLGHVKLSDSTSSTSASTAGVAATPKAVKAAYDLANSNTEKLGTTDISGIGDGTVTGAIVNNKEVIEDVTQSLTNVNNSKKTYLNFALPNVAADAKAVCDYINKNYLLGQIAPMYSVEFDVVASNADWFSGTLSTDLITLSEGRTVWGFVQQRTSSAENSTLYKYFAAGTGGAGSVRVIDETIADPMFCESIPGRNQITDFLNVNLSNRNSDINKIHYFGSDNPATAFTNSPYTAGPFYGYRVVRWCSESANTYHLVTVELHEQYPISGRVWSNTYDINNRTWYGWKCNQGNTFIDVGTVLKGTTTISAGATLTYTATRDCFVNVAAYAHGSGQNTKIYINNVCIFSPYTNNGSDAGLVIVDKTVPLKTGQTIKIENGTYTTSSYAIFAAF